MTLVKAEVLTKTYQTEDIPVQAIRKVDFSIEPGSFVSFVGPSGSGKSTLLNMIGTLDPPTSGKLWVADTDVSSLDRRSAANFRGNTIGFIFQDFNLLSVLTVYENIEYPLVMVQNLPAGERKKRVMTLLEQVGMADKAGKRPDQISGGQKQRVAVARALVTNPKLVLADEPTANLDSATAHRIIGLMKDLKNQIGTTFIFSTHDPKVMTAAEVIFTLEDGHLTSASNHQEGLLS